MYAQICTLMCQLNHVSELRSVFQNLARPCP